jgi:tyrosyl-tRNA synthetase
MKKFLEIFKERGFFHQATDEKGLAALDKFTAYIGFDCTATSLHVGSLMQIMILRWLKATGNTPIILLGGATTKVGDPSGKDESRPMITDETIAINKAGIKKVFDKFGLGDCIFVDNAEWLDKISYIEFLSKYGSLISVNAMMAKDSVKNRLERQSHLSFLEFNYMIFQAYDFVELNKRYNCQVQIGGSDQWGNITAGTELYRKLASHESRTTIHEFSPGERQEPINGKI